MRKLFLHFVVCLLLVATRWYVDAAPANPTPQVYYQPDGTETPLTYLNGNHLYSWLSDEKGYTIVKDEHGWYNYGTKTEDGDIISSGIKLGSRNPKKAGISPGLLHDEHKRPSHGLVDSSHLASVREHRSLLNVPENAICGFEGTKDQPCRLKAIVFLVRFNNHMSRVLPSPTEYDILFNNIGPDSAIAPSGSVGDVFAENSYGSFVLEAKITNWIPVPRSEAETVGTNFGLNLPGTKETWKQAITMCDQDKSICPFNLVDFDVDKDGVFDCTVVLHSGSAAETGGVDCETGKDMNGRIWSHATGSTVFNNGQVRVGRFYVASGVWDACPPGGKGTMWDIARVAVIAHECAHFLGLPDLYDTVGGQGLGSFELMANMWGWYGNQWYPPLLSAWSKLKLGWSKVTHVTGPGTKSFELGPACTSAEILYVDHRLEEGEYFLVEYRNPCGFDKELSHQRDWKQDRSGAAVWHIDESGKQQINYQSEGIEGIDSIHYVVALVQGDGNFNMEKSTPAGGNKGDRFDLFMKCDYGCGKSYKVDNKGITKFDGSKLPFPTTRGYATGTSYDTGISFTFGTYAATMAVEITLEGSDPSPNKYPGPDQAGNSPGLPSLPRTPPTSSAPTAAPTIVQTPSPTSPPVPFPTAPPTPPPTIPPTPSPTPQPTPLPTPLSTSPPTPSPTPPIPSPVEVSNFKGLEGSDQWEERLANMDILTGTSDIDAYFAHYELPFDPSHYSQLSQPNEFLYGSGTEKLVNVPIDCTVRDSSFLVLYRGVGKRRSASKIKHCGWFVINNEKFCPLVDLFSDRMVSDPDSPGEFVRPRIWQTCPQECDMFTNCSAKT